MTRIESNDFTLKFTDESKVVELFKNTITVDVDYGKEVVTVSGFSLSYIRQYYYLYGSLNYKGLEEYANSYYPEIKHNVSQKFKDILYFLKDSITPKADFPYIIAGCTISQDKSGDFFLKDSKTYGPVNIDSESLSIIDGRLNLNFTPNVSFHKIVSLTSSVTTRNGDSTDLYSTQVEYDKGIKVSVFNKFSNFISAPLMFDPESKEWSSTSPFAKVTNSAYNSISVEHGPATGLPVLEGEYSRGILTGLSDTHSFFKVVNTKRNTSKSNKEMSFFRMSSGKVDLGVKRNLNIDIDLAVVLTTR